MTDQATLDQIQELVRNVDGLRKNMDGMIANHGTLATQVDKLTGVVGQLLEHVEALAEDGRSH